MTDTAAHRGDALFQLRANLGEHFALNRSDADSVLTDVLVNISCFAKLARKAVDEEDCDTLVCIRRSLLSAAGQLGFQGLADAAVGLTASTRRERELSVRMLDEILGRSEVVDTHMDTAATGERA